MILDGATRLTPLSPSRLFVTWMLGNVCQYKCSYCNEKYHGGDLPFHPLDKVLNILAALPHCNVMFLGGEPTAWTFFETLLDFAPKHVNIQIISNGARPLAYWDRIAPKLHRAILTAHPEYVDIQRFLKVIQILGTRLIRVNVPMKPDEWDKCYGIYHELKANGVKVIPKVLLQDFGFTADKVLDAYTPEQLAWIKDHQEANVHTMRIKYECGKERNTNPGELLASEQGTNFKGWSCNTPAEFMGVDADGTIYNSMCKQRQVVGHIDTGIDRQKQQPMICEQNFCWCYSDIHTKKERHAEP
jgi:hypothetical protein